MTVGELIEKLSQYDSHIEVEVYQPGDRSVGIWELQAEIRDVHYYGEPQYEDGTGLVELIQLYIEA